MNKPPTKEQLANMAAQAARAGGATGPQMVQIDPNIVKKGEDMKCLNQIPKLDEKTGRPIEGEFFQCNGEIFVDAYRLKYVSPIVSPTGQQTVGNIMIGKLCVACGKIFSPDEWLKARNDKATANEKGGDA